MKVARLNGLLCAVLLTACTTATVLAQEPHELPSSSSSSSRTSSFVQVDDDAVFCVEGPACSGDAAQQPVGWSCPKKGDNAIDACMKGIKSFAVGRCVAPVDAECRVIPGTGSWGCVWRVDETSEPSAAPSEPESSSEASETTQIPAQEKPKPSLRSSVNAAVLASASATTDSTPTSSIFVWIGSVAAGGVAVVVVVAIIVVSKKRKTTTQRKQSGLAEIVITPENAPVVTPKTSKTVFVYTAQI